MDIKIGDIFKSEYYLIKILSTLDNGIVHCTVLNTDINVRAHSYMLMHALEKNFIKLDTEYAKFLYQ